MTLLGFGAAVAECERAAEVLADLGIEATVANARFAKPLDEELILQLARTTGGIITAEENVRAGGFGEAVLGLLADHHLADTLLANLTMPDAIVDHGPQKTFRSRYRLDGPGIAERVQELLPQAADRHHATRRRRLPRAPEQRRSWTPPSLQRRPSSNTRHAL
ncbi:MAG: transketolase C-terminal domain-containing protein [Dehalococcoidia bacterium]|nr:transketolase C-terminal domain-containing protein [Dehalococcoidia bacterium]